MLVSIIWFNPTLKDLHGIADVKIAAGMGKIRLPEEMAPTINNNDGNAKAIFSFTKLIIVLL